MKRTAKEIQNESNIKTLKRAREMKGLSRSDLAKRLNITAKAIERYENGRSFLSMERISKILEAMEISLVQFQKVKRGKTLNTIADRKKRVLSNKDRRSYQKIITKECKVLRSMRRIKKLSQDQASRVCGYSRPTIGHIENGRIELSKERVRHIVECYGFKYSDFEKSLGKEQLRDSVIDYCVEKIERLEDSKLEVVQQLLRSL